MNLRVVIRNWLLKPSKAEMENKAGQGKVAADLVWGHVDRELRRNVVRTMGVDVTANGLVFNDDMPAGTLAYTQAAQVGVDFGDVKPGELP